MNIPNTFMNGRTGRPAADEYIPFIKSATHIGDESKQILLGFLEFCDANNIKYIWHGETFN